MASTDNHDVSAAIQSEQPSHDAKYPMDDEKNDENSAYGDVDDVVVEEGDEIKESDYNPEEYKTLLKKIDRYLLPLMWVCYGIQQTDKTSLGIQALFGLREDTALVGQQYQWLTTVFYMAYLCGELPSNFLLQRWALGRTLSIYMFCWGICVICIAAAQNWTHLMVLRTLQGFFECTISPGFILVIGTWYRTEEHSSRSLFFQSANAGFGLIADLVMYGIGTHAEKHGGIAAWRCISLFLGSSTLVAALVCFMLLGSPQEVRWMNKDEKRMAAARIISNKSGRDVTGTKWNWDQVIEALKDPVLYFSTINAFLSSVPNGGLSSFGSLMYRSFGFTELNVLLVGIPRSVVSLLIFVIVGFYTRKVPNRRMYIMALACLPPFVGLLSLSLLPSSPHLKWTKWGLYFMTVPAVLSLFLGWTLIPSNISGRTKKTIVSSATFLGYCVGNMCGSQIFRTEDAPQYIPGTIGASICLGAEFLIICAWRSWYMWQNAKRERAARESGVSPETMERLGRELGEQDVTDMENPYFRYTL